MKNVEQLRAKGRLQRVLNGRLEVVMSENNDYFNKQVRRLFRNEFTVAVEVVVEDDPIRFKNAIRESHRDYHDLRARIHDRIIHIGRWKREVSPLFKKSNLHWGVVIIRRTRPAKRLASNLHSSEFGILTERDRFELRVLAIKWL